MEQWERGVRGMGPRIKFKRSIKRYWLNGYVQAAAISTMNSDADPKPQVFRHDQP